MFSVKVQAEPIVPGHLSTAEPGGTESVARDNCGAEVRFLGKVRNDPGSSSLTALVLEHFPGVTESEIQRIVDEARQRWSLQKAQVVHRVGRIGVGEVIVLVETAAAHRRAAYDANVFIMDYLKTQAPFWKQECFADGAVHWVEAKQSDELAARRWQEEIRSSPADGAPDSGARPRRIGALILAGGQGSRMGYLNKGLQALRGKPLATHVLDALRPQVQYAAISANHDQAHYEAMGVPVFQDDSALPVKGPLAGLLGALPHFPTDLDAILVAPCDTPFLPQDLVAQLAQALHDSGKAVAIAATQSNGHENHHAVFLIRPMVLLGLLTRLQAEADHSLLRWLRSYPHVVSHFEQEEAFVNVNDRDSLQHLQTNG